MARLTQKKNGEGKISGTLISIPLTMAKEANMLDCELNVLRDGERIIIEKADGMTLAAAYGKQRTDARNKTIIAKIGTTYYHKCLKDLFVYNSECNIPVTPKMANRPIWYVVDDKEAKEKVDNVQ